MYYNNYEEKQNANQCSCCAADLCLCFCIYRFSHDTTHFIRDKGKTNLSHL